MKNTTGKGEYRKVNRNIKKEMKRVKEEWIEKQCTEIEECIMKNNSRKAYQMIKELTQRKQANVNNIEDNKGSCLTEEKAVIGRWTEYCSDHYNHQTQGNPNILNSQDSSKVDDGFYTTRGS